MEGQRVFIFRISRGVIRKAGHGGKIPGPHDPGDPVSRHPTGPAFRPPAGESGLARPAKPRMGDLMSSPDQNPQKPGFIGENPNWGRTSLAGFAIVGVVLTLIIVFFR
jgi:hypothetical protein